MAYLIDGFNLIYKFPDLEELMIGNRLDEARIGLLQKLKRYAAISKKAIGVVFDGKKQPSLEVTRERYGRIDVYYSLDYSADYLIKQFVKKDNNPRMITVVTSDKDIIGYVTRFKAKTMKSEEFAEQLAREIDEWEAAKIPEKEDNPVLSDEEMSFWEGLFKRKKK